MTDQDGMGRLTVAQADGCRRFEYMEVVRRLDWAYLGCYDALVVRPVPPMEGDGTCRADDVWTGRSGRSLISQWRIWWYNSDSRYWLD